MNYPYEKFVLYRILRGDTKNEINAALTRYCLPEINEEDFVKHKDKTRLLGLPPVFKTAINKRCKSPVPQGAIDFLKFHEFDELFAFEEQITDYLKDEVIGAMDGAFSLHNAPFVRMAIHVLLFHKQPLVEIKDLILAGHNFSASELTLSYYQKFFFDTKKMKQEDWYNYVQKLLFREREVVFAALTNKLEDIKYLIKVPTNVEYSSFLKRALETANYKMNYYASLNTDTGDRNARSWASTGINAGEKYTKFSRGDPGDLMKQLQMEFESIDTGIESLDPLTASSVLPQASALNIEKDAQHVMPGVDGATGGYEGETENV
jgi:hypothetical protein